MRSTPSFAQIETDLRSDHQETRGRAMQTLLMSAKKDSRVHATALPLFQTMLLTAPDSWTVTSAARGVELIQGPAEGRKAWLTLLHHADDRIAASAALLVDAAAYTSDLLQMLTTRSGPFVRTAVIRSLGRTKNPAFLPTILGYLDKPGARVDAILALEELEDSRAIPNLEPLIQEETDSGMTDDRGCMLRISDLAASATRRLQYVSGQKYTSVVMPISGKMPSSGPVPQSSSVSPPTAKPAVSVTKKFRLPPGLFPYIPLIAAAVEIPWVVMLIFMQLFLTGAVARTRFQTHGLDALCLIPPLVGLTTALLVIAQQRPRRRAATLCLALGAVICGLMALPFGWELLN